MTRFEQNPPASRIKYLISQYGNDNPWLVIQLLRLYLFSCHPDRGEARGSVYSFQNWIHQQIVAAREKGVTSLEERVDMAILLDSFRDWSNWARSGSRLDETKETMLFIAAAIMEQEWSSKPCPMDGMIVWLARSLASACKADVADITSEDRCEDLLFRLHDDDAIENLQSWLVRAKPDLGGFSILGAIQTAIQWNYENRPPALAGEVVLNLSDGWTVQKLTECEAIFQEGLLMQNCLKDPRYKWCERVADGNTLLFSIRDPKNRPHVSIEFDPRTLQVKQNYGKQNKPPAYEYQGYAKQAVSWLNGIRSKKIADVSKIILDSGSCKSAADLAAADFITSGIQNAEGWAAAGLGFAPGVVNQMSGRVKPQYFARFPDAIKRHIVDPSARSTWTHDVPEMLVAAIELESHGDPSLKQEVTADLIRAWIEGTTERFSDDTVVTDEAVESIVNQYASDPKLSYLPWISQAGAWHGVNVNDPIPWVALGYTPDTKWDNWGAYLNIDPQVAKAIDERNPTPAVRDKIKRSYGRSGLGSVDIIPEILAKFFKPKKTSKRTSKKTTKNPRRTSRRYSW